MADLQREVTDGEMSHVLGIGGTSAIPKPQNLSTALNALLASSQQFGERFLHRLPSRIHNLDMWIRQAR